MLYLKLGQALYGLTSIYQSSAKLKEISPIGLNTDREPWKVYDQEKEISGIRVDFVKCAPGYNMHELKPGYTLEDITLDPATGLSIIDMSDERKRRQAAYDSAKIGEPALA